MNDEFDPTLVMKSPTEAAELEGISKQAVSKQVRKFVEEHDLTVKRNNRGHIELFSYAEYTNLRGEYSSSEKINSARGDKANANNEAPARHDSRDEAQRVKSWLEVDALERTKKIECGKLLWAEEVENALKNAGNTIKTTFNRLDQFADQLAVTHEKEGVHGVRAKLKKIGHELGNAAADELLQINLTKSESSLEDAEG